MTAFTGWEEALALATWVLPFDKAVTKLIEEAALLSDSQRPEDNAAFFHDAHTKAHGSSTLEQQPSTHPAFLRIEHLWEKFCSLELPYPRPCPSLQSQEKSDKESSYPPHCPIILSPSALLQGQSGTSLDICLFFAACLERLGLRPFLVASDNHVFLGCWLQDKSFPEAVTVDTERLRQLTFSGDCLLIEVTLATGKGFTKPSLEEACQRAPFFASQTTSAAPFILFILDIYKARQAGAYPITERYQAETSLAPLPEPRTREERWQHNLLDLSLRNNLLHFRGGKRCIDLETPDLAALEDFLAKDGKLIFASADEPLEQKCYFNENTCLAATSYTTTDLSSRQTKLYRESRSAIAEGGANILYFAFGFLSWKARFPL